MPATITHAFFADDLYDKLDITTKEKIKKEKKSLRMFAQNTDPLMFYNITNLKKGKNIRKQQYICHSIKTNEFFYNLITYIKKNKYYNDPKVLTFLYGFIAHFALDSNAHPYIIYKTGMYDKKDKSTTKYNCLHHYMETFIDNTMINERIKTNYKKFNIGNYVFTLKKFSNNLNNTINYTFNKTFNLKYMSKIYYTSLKQMKLFINLFRKDSYGIKKTAYKLIDKITPKTAFILDALSYNQKIKDENNYLNKTHKKWNYPIDKNITSTKSFKDIYNDSLNEALYIIKNINEYFYNDKEIDIDNLFKNKSYVTGIDCNSKLKQKYFEF